MPSASYYHRLGSLWMGVIAVLGGAACTERPAVCSKDSECPGEERCIEKICDGHFTVKMALAGKKNDVPPAWLNAGKTTFTLYCRPCHGGKGLGDGPASAALRPPPRDLTAATYKFAGVVDGLPHDEDFERILRGGLSGTAMLPWDLTSADLYAVIQYIKTFSPQGEAWLDPKAGLGERVIPPADDWKDKAKAIERGKVIYHTMATCQSCHPSYATRQEIYEMSVAAKAAGARGNTITSFRAGMFQPEAKESVSYKAHDVKMLILPPDFLYNPIRSLSPRRPEFHGEDLYRIIGSGIPGTAMPAWKGALPDRDLWALVHYVQSLVAMKDTSAADKLRTSLSADKGDWAPPAAVPPP